MRAHGGHPHGPALDRNPALADLLPSWRVGDLAPLDDSRNEALRQERLAAVLPRLTARGARTTCAGLRSTETASGTCEVDMQPFGCLF